jgi:hypothetical protein
LFLSVAAAVSCAAHDPACLVAAIPLSAAVQADGLEKAAATVTGECRVLSAGEIRKAIGDSVVSLQTGEAEAFLETLREGERLYYSEDVGKGAALLAHAWEAVEANPHLLPSHPEARGEAYRALLTGMRVRSESDPDGTTRLLDWLAVHMADQLPSVNVLPPLLAGRASEAVERARGTQATLAAPLPPKCPDGELVVDGRTVGRLPIAGQALPAGRHSVLATCGQKRSWVRSLDLTGEVALGAPDLDVEAVLRLGREGLALDSACPAALRDAVGRRLAASLSTAAVLFVPGEQEGGETAHLVTAGSARRLEKTGNFYRVEARHVRDRKGMARKVGKWLAMSLSLGLAGAGVALNVRHNNLIDSMSGGTEDNREEAGAYKASSIACYASAGAALLTGVVLFVLDRPRPRPVPVRFK